MSRKRNNRIAITAAIAVLIAIAVLAYTKSNNSAEISKQPDESVAEISTESETKIPTEEVIKILESFGYEVSEFELLDIQGDISNDYDIIPNPEYCLITGDEGTGVCSFEINRSGKGDRRYQWGDFKYEKNGTIDYIAKCELKEDESGQYIDSTIIYPASDAAIERQKEDSLKEATKYVEITANETRTKSAYEYVLEIMSKPQYWSEEQYFPEYSAEYLEKEAREALTNGSGWTLTDASTASFTRGYEGILTINFADHTAISIDAGQGIEYHFDFKKDEHYVTGTLYGGEERSFTLDRNADGYWNTAFGMLEKTFLYYEKIFEGAGFSLLEAPAGTLESLKTKEIHPVVLKEDDLIHKVWEQDGFSFNWELSEEISWVSDYKDVSGKAVPDSELYEVKKYGPDGELIGTYSSAKYSRLYLVLADKSSSSRYQVKDGSLWFEDISEYDNISESLATYYLTVALKKAYGYNGVYFTEYQNASGSSNPVNLDTKEDFEKGFSYDFDGLSQPILEILPIGDEFVGVSYFSNPYYGVYQELEQSIKELFTYYGKDYPFGDDYLGNFILVYSLDTQKLLGLR